MLDLAQLFLSIAGFGLPFGMFLLMSGRVKFKNEMDTLARMVAAFCLAVVAYWMVGAGLSGTPSLLGLIGTGSWAFDRGEMLGGSEHLRTISLFAVPALLVAAATAERGRFSASVILSLSVSILVVPIVAHWAWADDAVGHGWLALRGFADPGGAVVIFASAGFCALAVSAVLGPRHGRFPDSTKHPEGQSPTFYYFGLIMMIFGIALLSASQATQILRLPTMLFNSMIGAVFAGLSALLLMMVRKEKHAAADLINACLAGSIALAAFSEFTSPASAALAGLLTGLVALGLRRMLAAIEIDDPGNLISIFLSGGIIGALVAPVLLHGFSNSLVNELVIQLIGLTCIALWSFLVTWAISALLARTSGIRVSEADEARGLSLSQFGYQSEPDFIIGHITHAGTLDAQDVIKDTDLLDLRSSEFSDAIVTLRNETNRAIDRILASNVDVKARSSQAARMRLAEDTLRVKAEDVLLLLERLTIRDDRANGGEQFTRWVTNALQILMAPTLKDLEQYARHLPLQADLEELENMLIAATDTVIRCARQIELVCDLADANMEGFFSRDHSCDLARLLRDQSSRLQSLSEIRNNPIQIDCPVDHGLFVSGDTNAFTRILHLTAEGAFNRGLHKQGNPVRLELREHSSGHHIVFDCLDTGTALSARQVRAIVTPLSEQESMHDLGLAQILPLMLAARLIDAIGGEISLSSEHGLGTLMHCRFRKLQISEKAA